MKIIFFIFAFLQIIFCNLCDAQSAEHKFSFAVIDQETTKPLEFATITIEQCNCGGVTNQEGSFSINLGTNQYDITVSYIGYESYSSRINLSTDTVINIDLYESKEALSEVVVVAQKANENIDLPQMGVVRLQAKGLKKLSFAMGEVDILRGMTLLAGVNNAGEVSNGISVRGSSLDQNLILYDYAPVYNPTHIFGLFSVFTPEAISSVDLYRANIPSRFGGRVASVMDVKVKSPYIDSVKISGGIGLVSTRFSIESPIIKNKLMFMFNSRVGLTDFLLPIVSERLKKTKARFGDGTLKVLYLPTKKDQVTFTGFLSKDFYQLDLVTKIENINAKNNQYDFGILNGTLNWRRILNNSTSLETILVGSNYNSNILFPEINNDNKIEFLSKIEYLSLRSEIKKKVSPKFDYYLGLQSNRYKISPGTLNPGTSNEITQINLPSEISYELAGYINGNWSPLEKLKLSIGLRYNSFLFLGPYNLNTYDEYSNEIINTQFFDKGEIVNTYGGLEPRLGLVYKVLKNTSFKASYARVNQYLQNIYNSTTPLPSSRWKFSDPHIKPQIGTTYSLGVYQNLNNNGIEISLEGYYRKTDNVLTYKPGADFFLEQFIERDIVQAEGQGYGLEFSLNKTRGVINGSFNYTYARSFLKSFSQNLRDRINNNKRFLSDFDRPHVFNSTVNVDGESNSVSLNFIVQSGKPYTVANGVFEFQDIEVPIFLERNNSRLPVYHRLDFSWKIHYIKDKNKRFKGDWTFTVYNVYGRDNPFNIYYTQRIERTVSTVFSDNPLGAYKLSILNVPLISLTYNYTFK